MEVINKRTQLAIIAALRVENRLMTLYRSQEKLASQKKNVNTSVAQQGIFPPNVTPSDYVTRADTEVESIVLKTLQWGYPNDSFISEELPGENSCLKGSTDYTWYIDPLDGTINFKNKLEDFSFATMIGLAKGQEVIAGVIYNPVKQKLYLAEKGKGSFVYDFSEYAQMDWLGSQELEKTFANLQQKLPQPTPLKVSSPGNESDIIMTTIPFKAPALVNGYYKFAEKLLSNGYHIRHTGSAGLDQLYVATGQAKAAVILGGLGPWDVAAASVIVQEAGGSYFGVKSEQFLNKKGECGYIAALSPEVYEQLQPMANNAVQDKNKPLNKITV